MFEKKFELIFLRQEYGTMYLIGVLKSDSINSELRYKGKTYHLSLDKPSFSKPKTKIYILDFDTGSQLKFEAISTKLNPNELDLFMAEHIVKDLTAGAISDKKEKLINMILGAIMGGLLSALLMFFYMQNQINEIYKSLPIAPILSP